MNQHLSDLPFTGLDLQESLLRGVQEAGFEFCTPIQAATLPRALRGEDVAGQAQTGTGKTAAFLLATFHRLLLQPPAADRPVTSPRAIILAPTRELAVQIHKDAEALGRHSGFRLGLVFGGTGYDTQRKQLEAGVDVLIGTPGRLIDYFKQHIFDLRHVQVMVLDEADRMFDLGFIKDIRFLLRRMPEPAKRLSMLFSATLSYRVTELAYEHMNNPELVRIEPDKVTADRVTQTLFHTGKEEKLPLLVGLLRHMDPRRSLVFVNTRGGAERVSRWLAANGFNAEVLSGDVPQPKRLRLLENFQKGELPILVATDVAARGLHIPDVSHVFNFDLPQDAEDYVHRIGRTARAGASGDAVSFACDEYVFSLPEIEKYIGHKVPVARIEPELLAELKIPPPRDRSEDVERRPRRGRESGGRGRGERRGRSERGNARGGEGRRREGRNEGSREARSPQAAPAASPPSSPSPPTAPKPAHRPPERPATKSAPVARRRHPEKPVIG